MSIGRDLTPAKRLSLMALGLLRALATTVVLVVAYYVLPFNRASNASAAVLLAAGMAGVSLVVVWEVRAILRADHPMIKAVEALGVILPLFLLLFASAYFLMERATPASFGQPLSRTDALYFTVTTFATVGYGDITAKTEGARIMVIFQMLANLVILGFGVKIIFGAVQIGRQRQPTGRAEDSPGSVDSGSSGAGQSRLEASDTDAQAHSDGRPKEFAQEQLLRF